MPSVEDHLKQYMRPSRFTLWAGDREKKFKQPFIYIMVYSNSGCTLSIKPTFSTEDAAYGRKNKNNKIEWINGERETLSWGSSNRVHNAENYIQSNIESIQVWQ